MIRWQTSLDHAALEADAEELWVGDASICVPDVTTQLVVVGVHLIGDRAKPPGLGGRRPPGR